MSSYRTCNITCGCCGHTYPARILQGYFQSGPVDLDLNPHRPEVYDQVVMCPSCGYASMRIWEPVMPGAAAQTESAEYQSIFHNPDLSDVRKKLLLAASIEQASGNAQGAGYLYLMECWYLAEQGLEQERAAALKRAITEYTTYLTDMPDYHAAITLIDCLRQAGRFAEALESAESLRSYPLPEYLEVLVRYELELIATKDVGSHSQNEVTV